MLVYGLWVSLTTGVIAGAAALLMGHSPLDPWVYGPAAVMGAAFAIGVCGCILHCLRIGPTGPTVAVNNMGMLWPAVAATLWPAMRAPHEFMILGLLLSAAAMVCFGRSKPQTPRSGQQAPGVSARWAMWAFAGWVMAGVSMTAQYVAGIRAKDNSLAFVCVSGLFSAAVLLSTLLIKRRRLFRRREMTAAAIGGLAYVVATGATLATLAYYPMTGIPLIVVAPIVAVLVIGRVFHHERLDRPAWLACILGVVGILCLAVGRAPQ